MNFPIVLAFTILVAVPFSNPAKASMGFGGMPKLEDQYKCTKTKGKEQTVDVLIGGSSQRFQGIARSKDGGLLEVAGVISDYYPMPSEASNSTEATFAAISKREWDTFAVEIQLTNKLIVKKMRDSGEIPADGQMGDFLLFGGGFGMQDGAADDAVSNESKSEIKASSPYGGSASGSYDGGGMMETFGGLGTMGGMGDSAGMYGGLTSVSDSERDDIRKKALEIIDRREARTKEKLRNRQIKDEHDRIFAPPPVPEVRAVPPRTSDNLPPRPGDVVEPVKTFPRQGDMSGLKPKSGDIAMHDQRPGDIAAMKLLPGARVGGSAGSVIGTANSITFTALMNAKAGKISRMIYREENRPGNSLRFSDTSKVTDPILARITPFIDRIRNFAKCCERDSSATCDQKYSPESTVAIQNFRNQTLEVMKESESAGGAIFNPFGGRPPANGPNKAPTSR